jgi:Zn ribbon nucleic-acid-binding protein
MIQHRIANSIKNLETIRDSLHYYDLRKTEEEESLKNLVSAYMQQCTKEEDEDGISSLIRYLYWYTNIPVKEIGEFTDLNHQHIVSRSGSLVFSASCARCQSVFASKRKSRSDLGSKICPSCESQDILDSHKVFLEDWIDSTWANHKNPKMDKGSYTAYLHSKHWKKVRSIALNSAGYKCQACSNKDAILDVHHNSYDRLGNEDPSDLIVLCRSCHAKVHEK